MTDVADMPPRLRVDLYLDLICPWCWIGLRHLRAAWDGLQAAGLVAHDAGLLRPVPPHGLAPAGGVPRLAFDPPWPVAGAVPAAELLPWMRRATAAAPAHAG